MTNGMLIDPQTREKLDAGFPASLGENPPIIFPLRAARRSAATIPTTSGAGYIGSHTVEDMCRSAWRFARQNGK